MFRARFALAILLLLFVHCAAAQQSAPRSLTTSTSISQTQGSTVLRRALAALAASTPITDVNLSGTVRRTAGSVVETGSILMQGLASGEASVTYTFPSGQTTETRTESENGPIAQWTGPEHTTHAVQPWNLLAASPWLSPPLLLSRVIADTRFVCSNSESIVWNSQPVQRLTISFQVPGLSGDEVLTIQRLSKMDVYFDPETFVPLGLFFNLHTDDDANTDIPVEIRFSDYRALNGITLPYHVQQYINNGLALDIQLESVVFNSGLSQASFQIQ
jgi:hypothetical protein